MKCHSGIGCDVCFGRPKELGTSFIHEIDRDKIHISSVDNVYINYCLLGLILILVLQSNHFSPELFSLIKKIFWSHISFISIFLWILKCFFQKFCAQFKQTLCVQLYTSLQMLYLVMLSHVIYHFKCTSNIKSKLLTKHKIKNKIFNII